MKEPKIKKMYKKVLPNGVTLYMYSDKNLKRTYANYIIGYGNSGMFNEVSINGKKEKLPFGMAHFLEHMLLEQSKYGNMLHYFLSKNYDMNAQTHDRFTRFFILGYKDMKDSIEKLIRIIDEPAFTKESIEKVKPAVIEELKKINDKKYTKAFACAGRNLYAGYEEKAATYNTLGSEEETKAFTYELARKAYDMYYYDANKKLVIAGNIDIDEMEEFVLNIYKSIKPHKKIGETVLNDKFPVRKKKEVLYDVMNNTLMVLAFKRKYTEKKNIFKENIYRNIYYRTSLYDNDSFKNRLNDEKIIIGDIIYDQDVFNGINEIFFMADILNEELFEKELINYLKTNIDNISEEDFNLYKKNYIASSITNWDDPYSVFSSFTISLEYFDEIDYSKVAKSLDYNEFKEHIKTINYDEYTKVIMENKN